MVVINNIISNHAETRLGHLTTTRFCVMLSRSEGGGGGVYEGIAAAGRSMDHRNWAIVCVFASHDRSSYYYDADLIDTTDQPRFLGPWH